jgi:DNA (cytosine-5)-methyltransferase 1
MKVVELFSGIGSQTQALKNIGVNHTSICCEWKSKIHDVYEAIHGKTPNLGDITKVSDLPDCDLMTYSFPCQDLSLIGNKQGLDEGAGTRSSLLWEVKRLLVKKAQEGTLPETLLLENVKQLACPKHIGNFKKWLEFLEGIGYQNTWKVVNAYDYGIPQKRERVFVVSTRSKPFVFSTPKIHNGLVTHMNTNEEVKAEFGDVHFYSNPNMRDKIIKSINNIKYSSAAKRVYGRSSCIHALTTQCSHPVNFGAVLYHSGIDKAFPLSATLVGKTEQEIAQVDLGFDINDVRLATQREVFRLMGFGDVIYDKVKAHIKAKKLSPNFMYHIAGNSIVVPVLEDIFTTLYK